MSIDNDEAIAQLTNVELLPRAYGEPLGAGVLRREPADFFVDEVMEVDHSDDGEHLWLHVEKTALNTADVAKHFARVCEVPQRNVGYAGRKDRNAVTRQWFSVQLPGRPDPQNSELEITGLKILSSVRHNQKLRTGGLQGNNFNIRIRDIELDESALTARIALIQVNGVANYFGEQRFGRGGSNIRQALDWFGGRFKPKSRDRRSMMLSASRSALFNAALAQQLPLHNAEWPLPEEGDWLLLGNSGGAGFLSPATSSAEWSEVERRFSTQQLQPALPLWGERGKVDAELWEKWRVLLEPVSSELVAGLGRQRLNMDWRRARVAVPGLRASYENGTLQLSMFLPSGSFATAVIREICTYCD